MQRGRPPRIGGGALKGLKLVTSPHVKVRPASARARRVLFDLLGERVRGSSVLDLFAGLGTVGLEALSRGASRAVFVEQQEAVCRLLGLNIDRSGCRGTSVVLCMSVEAAIAQLEAEDEGFDIVFVDPPYGIGEAAATVSRLLSGALLKPAAVVAVEHGRREEIVPVDEARLLWRRRMGYTVLSGYLFRPEGRPSNGVSIG
jgi:16S rRNA (guanine966-N2)-methyltransferase